MIQLWWHEGTDLLDIVDQDGLRDEAYLEIEQLQIEEIIESGDHG